jgi:hypothetical protein
MGKRIARERGVPNASCEPTLNRTQRVKVEDAAPAITCQIGRKDVLDDKALCRGFFGWLLKNTSEGKS